MLLIPSASLSRAQRGGDGIIGGRSGLSQHDLSASRLLAKRGDLISEPHERRTEARIRVVFGDLELDD